MSLAYDPARDTHLDLLDVHLLPLLKERQRTPEELLAAAHENRKLAGVDLELCDRWCQSARVRYLAELHGTRYGISPRGRQHLARLQNAARAAVAKLPGWMKLGGGGAALWKGPAATAVLVPVGMLLAAPVLGAGALVANTQRFLRSERLVGHVIGKEEHVRRYP